MVSSISKFGRNTMDLVWCFMLISGQKIEDWVLETSNQLTKKMWQGDYYSHVQCGRDGEVVVIPLLYIYTLAVQDLVREIETSYFWFKEFMFPAVKFPLSFIIYILSLLTMRKSCSYENEKGRVINPTPERLSTTF